MAIVLWIGIIITAQAFQTTPPSACAGRRDWTLSRDRGLGSHRRARRLSGGVAETDPHALTMQKALETIPNVQLSGFVLHGLLVLERGYIFTCMILAAIAAFLIDRKFYTAAVWSLIAAAFAASG